MPGTMSPTVRGMLWIESAREITGVCMLQNRGVDDRRFRAAQTREFFPHMLVHRQCHGLHRLRRPVAVLHEKNLLLVAELPQRVGHVHHDLA